MAALPEVIPISDLRLRQREILARLGQGPVVLTQHGRAAAVLISPEEWNHLIEALEDLQDAAEAAQAYEEWKRDPSTGKPWEEIRAELVAEGLLDE